MSVKRNVNWHFGISVAARTAPIRHVRIIGRLIFTTDGGTPLSDPSRMHRLRRSFAKGWRNARWRDMLLAFLYWLANGRDELAIATSSTDGLTLRLPPMTWTAPVSMPPDMQEEESDDDDPAVEETTEFETDESEESVAEITDGET